MEQLKKWRLILGNEADPDKNVPVEGDLQGIDNALEMLYNTDRKGGLGKSTPIINRWLGDIRQYFPASVVQMMQRDALEKLNLSQMLLQPELLESLEPDVHLVATLLTLNKSMPEQTRATARAVVQKVVEDLEKRLKMPFRETLRGALSRVVRNRRPKSNEIDWHQTIRINLKNYQSDLKTIVPEQLRGYGRRGQALRHVIFLADQSGSMASSVVYSAVFGAVMASIKSFKTHFVAFDTEIVDLSHLLADPVELLFGTQLGGGTDINRAVAYTETLITKPNDTILILVSDLFEGGNAQDLLRRLASIVNNGVQVIVLLALSDEGKPAFDKNLASKLPPLSIPAFACTPDRFGEVMAKAINRQKIDD